MSNQQSDEASPPQNQAPQQETKRRKVVGARQPQKLFRMGQTEGSKRKNLGSSNLDRLVSGFDDVAISCNDDGSIEVVLK